jgi:signal peptidase I
MSGKIDEASREEPESDASPEGTPEARTEGGGPEDREASGETRAESAVAKRSKDALPGKTDKAPPADKSADKNADKKKTALETEEEAANRRTSNFKTIAGAVALAIFIRVVLFEAFMIDGPSMEPTLLNGDRVVVAKYAFGLFLPGMHEAVLNWGSPNVGDVIIVNSPMDGVDIVKRVIGVPGDRVEVREDEVFVNGESILRQVLGPCPEGETSDEISECVLWEEGVGDRTWRSSHDPHDADSMAVREVPPGHVLVLGDHRNRSNDSRNPLVGMIPVTRIKGRALSIYWSSEDEMRWDRMFTNIR